MGRGGLFGIAGLVLFSVVKALNRPFCKYASLRLSKFGSSPTEVPSPCAIHVQVLMSEEFPAPLAPTKPLQTCRKERLGLGKGRGLAPSATQELAWDSKQNVCLTQEISFFAVSAPANSSPLLPSARREVT